MPSTLPRIAAVCTVENLFPVEATGIKSGIHKEPREEPIRLLQHGVLGDVQGDREHHGGLFKAVYAFARETREEIAAQEGREDFRDGFFGENLVTENFPLDEIVIGTRLRVGSAELEATVPRIPCRTFGAWVGTKGWGRRFNDFGRCGSYFAVLSEGHVAAGDVIEVLDVPDHGVSVSEFFRGLDGSLAPASVKALLDWAEGANKPLYTSMARTCLQVLADAGEPREFPAQLMTDGRGP